MKQVKNNAILLVLLTSYIIVGVLGTTPILDLLGPGAKTIKITKTKSNAQATLKVYWTQHKHIPSNVKISIPTPVLYQVPGVPGQFICSALPVQDRFDISAAPLFSLHSSHSPPRA